MANFLHSLIIFAFLATGFADTSSVHQAYGKSSIQTLSQIASLCNDNQQSKSNDLGNSCAKSVKSASNQAPSDKNPLSQPLSECEMLHCNFHYLFVVQTGTIERAPSHDTHRNFAKSKPYIVGLTPSKRPPRTFS